MKETNYFAQRVQFKIDGGDDLNRDFLSKRMMALYSVAADVMNNGGIEAFNANYDNLTEYPMNVEMNVEIYDWLYDRCFTELANKIADAYSAKLPGGRMLYLDERSAFVFDPETEVAVMKGYIR